VIHQVYELWFKQILHEGSRLRATLYDGDTHRALFTLKRLLTILKTLVAQVDILETMTPTSFNSFRDRLEAASGFESLQFRQVEFLLGHKRRPALEHYPPGTTERAALEEYLEAPTVWDAFLSFLSKLGFEVPPAALERDVRDPPAPSEPLQEVLLGVYRQDALASQVC